METEAKTQETKGDLDDIFVVLAEDDEGFGIIQCTSRTRVLAYTARKGRKTGYFYKGSVPLAIFVDLAREVLEKVDAGEIEVE